MKFFVMINVQSAADTAHSVDDIDTRLRFLQGMKDSGVLAQAWIKIGGGTVYILNADSFADVRNAFRDSRLSLEHDCEIFMIDETQPTHLLN